MIGKSTINPKGYGNPIAVLYTSSGIPIAFRIHNYSAFNQKENYFHISKVNLKESEEDGVECTLTLESANMELIDHPALVNGGCVKVAFGYIIKNSLRFGPPYQLIIQDYKANYGDRATFELKLVDSQTFSQIAKDSQETDPNTELQKELDKVKEIEDGIKTPEDLKKIFEELNRLKLNFEFRKNKLYFKVPTSPGGDNALAFYDINDLRKYLKGNSAWILKLGQKINDVSDNTLVQLFATEYSGVQYIATYLKLYKSPLKDLYGFPLDLGDNTGHTQWLKKLDEMGLLSILQKMAIDLGKSVNSVANDKELLDKIFEILMDQKALKLVEQDVNLSVKANLEKILNETEGGPYNIADTGDGSGPRVIQRDLDKQPFMHLVWKGGTGDLLKCNFETDFYSAPISSSVGVSIDPESGDLTTSTEISLNHNNGIVLPQSEVSQMVDKALSTIQENKENESSSPINFSSMLDTPYKTLYTPGKSTARAGGYTAIGNWAVAIDNTAVYLRPAILDLYLCKPGTIKQIQDEIDNRKKDRNLKQIKCSATILGRPDIRSGITVIISGVAKKFAGRYYALAVNHNIDLSGGYTVDLEFGKIPMEETKGRVVETEENKSNTQDISYRVTKGGKIQIKHSPEDWDYLSSGTPIVRGDIEGASGDVWYTPQGEIFNMDGQFNLDAILTKEGVFNVNEFRKKLFEEKLDPMDALMRENGIDPSKAPNEALKTINTESTFTINRLPKDE
jgi:hypothetical protein